MVLFDAPSWLLGTIGGLTTLCFGVHFHFGEGAGHKAWGAAAAGLVAKGLVATIEERTVLSFRGTLPGTMQAAAEQASARARMMRDMRDTCEGRGWAGRESRWRRATAAISLLASSRLCNLRSATASSVGQWGCIIIVHVRGICISFFFAFVVY